MLLQDQVVWITGASSGIGEALALEASRRGAKVVLSARNVGALENVRARCSAPEKCLVVPMDVTKLEEMPAKAKQVLEAFGQIDVLVLNAGISQRGRAIDTKIEVDQAILQTNFLGPVALTKAVLPAMVARKSGCIAVVSSLVGKFGTQLRTSYAASKHALHGFYDGLRAEHWQDGIQVSIICPGYVRTEVSRNALDPSGEKHGVMDPGTDTGMDPTDFAERMLDAIEVGKDEVYIGGREMIGIYMKRFLPGLFSKFIRRARIT